MGDKNRHRNSLAIRMADCSMIVRSGTAKKCPALAFYDEQAAMPYQSDPSSDPAAGEAVLITGNAVPVLEKPTLVPNPPTGPRGAKIRRKIAGAVFAGFGE
ncbi:MAG: hypothetical protein JWO89_3220 [Verrucomicrobiaceae bacterium]|nr:hypothetical protein [Verrucomicrobiaceae bacterium]